VVHNLADALERFAVRVLAVLRKELQGADRLLELLTPLTVTNDRRGEDDDHGNEHDDDDDAANDQYEELVHLLRWLKIDRFDRRTANRELARGAAERVA